MRNEISPIIELSEANFYSNCILGYGHFNSIHPGHIRYLKHAREINKLFVVAILKDLSCDGLIFNQMERATSLAQLGIADAIILLPDNSLNNAVKKINPKEVILGKEYENSELKDIKDTIKTLNKVKKSIFFHAGEISYASSELLTLSEDNLKNKREQEFLKALKRQNITVDCLIETSNKLKKSNLIVIGDSILDQYTACEAIGMSAEAPVIVVKELDEKNFLGGASIVASHISSIGGNCKFISLIGNDEEGSWIRNSLEKNSVISKLIVDKSRPTTFKKRYLVENQKLFRVSRLDDHMITKEMTKSVLNEVESLSAESDGIVISDFAYGLITDELIIGLEKCARRNNLNLYGDSQSSSQIGDVLRMKNFTLLCPNEKEARIAMNNKDIGLDELCRNMITKTNCQNLIMKLGADGFVVYSKSSNNSLQIQAFPALSVNPVDVSGAGDTLLSIMATGMCNETSIMKVAALACCAASIAVDSMGNNPIDIEKVLDKAVNIIGKN